MEESICLNGPHCRHPFCPEHSSGLNSGPDEGRHQKAQPSPVPAGLSQLDRVELSLFRLAQWLRDLQGARNGYDVQTELILMGHKLDKSLRGEL